MKSVLLFTIMLLVVDVYGFMDIYRFIHRDFYNVSNGVLVQDSENVDDTENMGQILSIEQYSHGQFVMTILYDVDMVKIYSNDGLFSGFLFRNGVFVDDQFCYDTLFCQLEMKASSNYAQNFEVIMIVPSTFEGTIKLYSLRYPLEAFVWMLITCGILFLIFGVTYGMWHYVTKRCEERDDVKDETRLESYDGVEDGGGDEELNLTALALV